MTSTLLWGLGTALSSISLVFLPTTRASESIPGTNGAEVYLPGSEGFAQANARWSAVDAPSFDTIVKVKNEAHVQAIIKYANTINKPFLTISGGHGQHSALGNLENGIGIWLRGINHIDIVDNGTAALIGGGVLNGDLIPTLWNQGKQTTTTGCDCVGYVAPVLGGGHGWLQGRYGLATDQLLSARMVLANGSAITVSDQKNEDLFWAIRGAGHNFGVVTEIKVKIYDVGEEQKQWAVSGFTFEQEKLESVFAVANTWLESKDRPKEMVHFGLFGFNYELDPKKPLVSVWVYWQGPAIPSVYTDPLYALNPLAVDSSVTNLQDVNQHMRASKDGVTCAKGYSRLFYPVSLFSWSLPNLRAALDIFSSMPPAYNSSVVLLEAYSTNLVHEIPSKSTAYPDRESEILASPMLTYAADPSLDEEALEFGEKMRNALLVGTGLKLNAYVNYARGDESVEAVYGYENWRLDKLRGLKQAYDPEGRFSFYAPIE
ncbi:FAD-binding domain-containing protein [Massarina eburnea CBS 473.64]|uniref:FAD-binding domain-containing protein n=1 Tax=Massarina eburnea CBS 473.64 TaxID=1395130 RepID=A0A6A6S4N0_9PLEO|nr:FAD-binding domain-containing protein [Massarina eburnea CBS 473.64]